MGDILFLDRVARYFPDKTFNHNHTCYRILKNHLVDRKWVGKKLLDKIRTDYDLIANEAFKYMVYQY